LFCGFYWKSFPAWHGKANLKCHTALSAAVFIVITFAEDAKTGVKNEVETSVVLTIKYRSLTSRNIRAHAPPLIFWPHSCMFTEKKRSNFLEFNYLKCNLLVRGFIQKFLDWVDNEISNSNNKHSLRSNTKGYGDKTH
jgi:hypothetical protein